MTVYVFDTNILLSTPKALEQFPNHTIIIPIDVVNEIDAHKGDLGEVGANARLSARLLDQYSESGNISVGVMLDNQTTIMVDPWDEEYTERIEKLKLPNVPDSRIIFTAIRHAAVLISNDIAVRIKARINGIEAVSYESLGSLESSDDIYGGITKLEVDANLIDEFYASGECEVEGSYFPNHYLLLQSNTNESHTAIGKWDGKKIQRIAKSREVSGIRAKNLEQTVALDALLNPDIDLVTMIGKAGCGKAQPLDAKILAPDGWVDMGLIKPNDYVIGRNGKPTRVLGVFPQGLKDIYRVSFSDGSSTECCDDHLWETQTVLERDYGREGQVRSLAEIRKTLRYGKQGKKNHSIPMVEAVQFKGMPINLPPYVLGALLGDGCIKYGSPLISSADEFIASKIRNLLPGMILNKKKGSYDYSIICEEKPIPRAVPRPYVATHVEIDETIRFDSLGEACKEGFIASSIRKVINGQQKQHKGYRWDQLDADRQSSNPLKNELLKLQLWGLGSSDKFVPKEYLFGTVENRISLLHGLMDTDGTVDVSGHTASFSTISKNLSEDVVFLVRSLGGTAKIKTRLTFYSHKGEKRQGKESFRVTVSLPPHISPFSLPRKAQKYKSKTKYIPRRYIDTVEYVGKKEAQCIMVEDSEHLYVTDDFVVTHNTLLALSSAIDLVLEKKDYDKIILIKAPIPMGRDVGYLPGTLFEKVFPYFQSYLDNLEIIFNLRKTSGSALNVLEELMALGKIELVPPTFVRGRSIPRSIIILDEAQNINKHEIKTIATRLGENSKLIVMGDIKQIDTNLDALDNGLTCLVEAFKDENCAAHITLNKGERSTFADLAANKL